MGRLDIVLHRPDVTAPDTPTGFAASLNGTVVTLTCNASLDAIGGPNEAVTGVVAYRFYSGANPGGPFTEIATPAIPSVIHDMGPGVTRYFRVAARDYVGNESVPSANVVVTTTANTPPVWAVIPTQYAVVGAPFVFDLRPHVSDAQGQAITIAYVAGLFPTGLSFNAATSIVSGTPTTLGQQFGVTFSASDGIAAAVETTVQFASIDVAEVAFVPQPGFTVTSATGLFEAGAEITITGTGFGSGPTAVIFDQIPTGTVGAAVPLTAEIGQWNRYGEGNVARAPRVVSTPTRSGGLAVTGNDPNLAAPRNLSREYIGAQFSEVFVCCSIAFRDGKIGNPSSGSNMKLAWAYTGSTTSGPGTMDCVLGTWYDAGSVGIAGNAGVDTAFMLNRSIFRADTWNTMQAWLKPGNPIGVANDTCYMRVDNTVTKAENTRTDKRIFGLADRALYFTRLEVLGWHGNWVTADSFDPILDDIYVAVGPNAAARVMVGNAATWATCNDMAICQPVSWADTQVVMMLRTGAFTALIGKYLYLVDATNTPRLVGQFATSAAGTVTLWWNAPTTGDTSIDYYRVEWGTVVNGQWGYFLNSRRVDAPTTRVVLTLPPGEYAYRVITVAADGEESAPAYLGWSVVGGGPASLRPAILPPIPAWVATGTIGLRAPHDLSTSGQQFVTPLTNYATTIDIGPAYAGGGFVANVSNRRYRLTTDMICNGVSAIEIRASNVLIDLNGHTIVYFNQSGPVSSSTDFSKCGIWGNVSASVQGNIEIINGNIIQGAGDVTNTPTMGYGRGANPIRLDSLSNLGGKTVYYRGLYIRHSAKYAGAINHYNTSGPAVVCEYCTFVDEGNLVYLRTNQHAEVRLDSFGNDTEVRYCRFQSARQVAVWAKRAHHNEIHVDCWWTNSCGVQAPFYPGVRIHSNNIYIVGTHPQGVFIRDTTGCQVYDNWIESKFTRPGELLPSPTGDIDDVQNRATGITFRFGDDSNLQVYGNTILAWAEDDSVVHPVTSALYDAESRGVFYFKYPTATLANNRFYGNLIAALNVDGAASAMTLGLSGNATGLSFDGNWLVANHTHFWLHDSYGSSLDGNPVIGIGNVIEKVDAHAVYRTNRHGGNATATVTATFNANHWRGGSWPVTNSNFGSGHVITYTNEPAST